MKKPLRAWDRFTHPGALCASMHRCESQPGNESSKENQNDRSKQLPVYRQFVADCLWPDPLRKRAKVQIAEAKRAISQYERATGDAAGTAELMLTFVEQGTGFAADLGYGDEDFFSSLEGMLARALDGVCGELLIFPESAIRHTQAPLSLLIAPNGATR